MGKEATAMIPVRRKNPHLKKKMMTRIPTKKRRKRMS